MEERGKLLVVDDEESIREQMRWAFADEYEVFLAPDGKAALDLMEAEGPEVVALDLSFAHISPEPSEGLNILQAILNRDPRTKVIVVTGSTEKDNALKAVKMGAVDFYHKPIDLDELKVIVDRARHMYQLERENYDLHRRLENDQQFEKMIGSSLKMKEVFAQVRKAAATNAAVLIVGESGTGKELIARALHEQSLRIGHPFIPINCTAIPSELLESELFGHEKGSFTGADETRQGKFELAEGGTLFLDEIGEMPPKLQIKLLRFLQDKNIERVGGRELIQLDVRIISATNRDLKKAVVEGRFREDLYYRINVIEINVPPLKERGDDIMLLANTYLEITCSEEQVVAKGFSHAAEKALKRHTWPGNVRELENRIRRAVIMAEGRLISSRDLDLAGNETEPFHKVSKPLKKAREETESRLIRNALKRHHGNISKASMELCISRSSFYDLMRKYDINP